MKIVRIPGTEVALVRRLGRTQSQWTVVGREVFDQYGKPVNSVAAAEVLEELDSTPDPVRATTELWRILSVRGTGLIVVDDQLGEESNTLTMEIEGQEYTITVTEGAAQ